MNRLSKLATYGQSYWMDDLSRDLLRSGDLPRGQVGRERPAGKTRVLVGFDMIGEANSRVAHGLLLRCVHCDEMTDVHTPEQRSFNMSRISGRDTKPEMLVRRMIHAAGFRYRLHVKDLPGKPDLVFPKAGLVLFVHGCFWHMHKCKYGKPAPANNRDFWAQKRGGNADRDKRKGHRRCNRIDDRGQADIGGP